MYLLDMASGVGTSRPKFEPLGSDEADKTLPMLIVAGNGSSTGRSIHTAVPIDTAAADFELHSKA